MSVVAMMYSRGSIWSNRSSATMRQVRMLVHRMLMRVSRV